MRLHRILTLAAILSLCCTAAKSQKSISFDDGAGPLVLTGAASMDVTMGRGGAGAALKLAPDAKAIWRLRELDGAGKVEFWVYENMATPSNPKARRVGPRWGLLQSDGRVLVVGAIYAPYLAGGRTYAASDSDQKMWFNVQYLGEARRKKGWHKWTFDMNPDRGLRILFDGKDVNARRKRFDWNKTKFRGFMGVVLFGDSGKGAGQTIWVDDLRVALGGAMHAKPTPPPPPPPVVPDKDPPVANPAKLLDTVMGQHPRLLFGKEDIPALKAFARGAGKEYFDQMVQYLPVCKAPKSLKFRRDATDGQRQGLWRMPTLALYYTLTGDKRSLDAAIGFVKMLVDLNGWETTAERDSGMSSANMLIGAALVYDCMYHDLPADLREKLRKKLIYQARAQYYGGHLKKNKATPYWQNDPANNQRWHRDAGLTLAVLAAYEGRPEENWILTKTFEELKFINKWLPPDGSSHEGPGYLIFGGAHLTLACQASDRCFGTRYLDGPFFRRTPLFRLHTLAPGFKQTLPFGDGGGMGNYCPFLFKCASRHRLAHVQAALMAMRRENPKSFWLGWMMLLWCDPSLVGGDIAALGRTQFFQDVGVVAMRSGWGQRDAAALFKCGPFGGYKLNEFRNSHNFCYINVAHDDPDANSFLIYAQGALLAETDRYSKHKHSSNYNTILVNGMGQMAPGRPEGGVWSQPATGKYDMTKMAVITAFKDAGDVVAVEGEAAGSYLAYRDRRSGRSRPALDRFRRTFVWVKDSYILVLDDVRAPRDVEITWLVQGPELTEIDAAAGKYRLSKGGAACDFRIVPSQPMTKRIVVSGADNKGKPLGWRQLQATAKARVLGVVSLYNPWRVPGLEVTVTREGRDAATIAISGKGFSDLWEWKAATGKFVPSTLRGARDGGFRVEVDEQAAVREVQP